MKKLVYTFGLLVALVSNTHAQKENTLLWKVEAPDSKNTSYLVGTLHMICADDFIMPEKVAQVVNQVDQVYLEINLTDPAEMQAMQSMSTTSKKISDELSAAQLAQLNEKVAPIIQMPIENFDTYGLMTLYSYAILKTMDCTEIKSFENELIQLTLQKQLPIKSFETVAQQMQVMKKSFSTQDYYQQLLQIEQYGRDFKLAVQAYKNENIAETVRLISQDAYMTAAAKEYMVKNRNIDWATQLQDILPKNNTLIAVGAAHLVGEHGLIQLLQKLGYKVTPVV